MGAAIEWQEIGVVARQLCRHKHIVLTHGKMHQCPTFEGQQWFWLMGIGVFGQTGFFILGFGLFNRLFEF